MILYFNNGGNYTIKKSNLTVAVSILTILCAFILSSCSIVSYSLKEMETSTEMNTQKYEMATVERVVDGDTIIVLLDNGDSERVRLIGVDTPESVHPDQNRNTYEGKVASEYTKKLLPKGTYVYLEKDISDRDQYNRLLRYVWLKEPSSAPDRQEIASYMVNAILVENGYAEAKEYQPDTKYASIFEILENTQREAA